MLSPAHCMYAHRAAATQRLGLVTHPWLLTLDPLPLALPLAFPIRVIRGIFWLSSLDSGRSTFPFLLPDFRSFRATTCAAVTLAVHSAIFEILRNTTNHQPPALSQKNGPAVCSRSARSARTTTRQSRFVNHKNCVPNMPNRLTKPNRPTWKSRKREIGYRKIALENAQ
jgi:hypothetical protein